MRIQPAGGLQKAGPVLIDVYNHSKAPAVPPEVEWQHIKQASFTIRTRAMYHKDVKANHLYCMAKILKELQIFISQIEKMERDATERDFSRTPVFLAIMVLAVAYWGGKDIYQNSKTTEYLSGLHLRLKGVITYIENSHDHNFGIVGVNVTSSNRKNVGNTKESDMFCVVQNDKAEFYQAGVSEMSVGDHVAVNTDDRSFILYKRDGEVVNSDLYIDTGMTFGTSSEKKRGFEKNRSEEML